VNAAVPNVPPPVGIVRVAPAAGQVRVPAPPLLVRAVVRVAFVTCPAVKLAAVPEALVRTIAEGVPKSPPEVKYVFVSKAKVPAAVILTRGVPETQDKPAIEVKAEEAAW